MKQICALPNNAFVFGHTPITYRSGSPVALCSPSSDLHCQASIQSIQATSLANHLYLIVDGIHTRAATKEETWLMLDEV